MLEEINNYRTRFREQIGRSLRDVVRQFIHGKSFDVRLSAAAILVDWDDRWVCDPDMEKLMGISYRVSEVELPEIIIKMRSNVIKKLGPHVGKNRWRRAVLKEEEKKLWAFFDRVKKTTSGRPVTLLHLYLMNVGAVRAKVGSKLNARTAAQLLKRTLTIHEIVEHLGLDVRNRDIVGSLADPSGRRRFVRIHGFQRLVRQKRKVF